MDWNPGPKYELYLARIQDLLSNEERTVRDIYYALESRGFPDECRERGYDFEYRYVKRAVKKGRRAGYIDPALIVDASRRPGATVNEGYDDAREFVNRHISGVWNSYTENVWDDHGTRVEVWLEKQSLVSVFQPICREYNVRLEATQGDWSDSKVYEACQRLAGYLEADEDIRILYFGDFNPSGLHAPVAVQNTMRHYGVPVRPEGGGPDQDYFDIWPFWAQEDGNGARTYTNSEGSIKFERLALNVEQVEQYDLPENPTPSSTDKDKQLRERFMRLVSEGRDVNIELNALKEFHRDDLEQTLRDGIEKYRDDETVAAVEERIEERADTIESAVSIDWSALD